MDKHGNLSNTDLKSLKVIKARCMTDMLFFTKYFFKAVNGSRFIENWHHRIIIEYLEKVMSGEIRRLMINMPPRHSKTLLAVISFISYCLSVNPRAKFMHLSYSDDLVLLNSLDIKRLLETDEYRLLFKTSLRKDARGKRRWETEEGGGLYVASTQGQITGLGAGKMSRLEDEDTYINFEATEYLETYKRKEQFNGAIIIDDPIKPGMADYNVLRDKVNNGYNTTIRNRANSRQTPIIIIMQRTHPEDLCGFLQELEPDKWTVLSLPALTSDEDGKLKALWEDKMTVQELLDEKKADKVMFDRQYMQDPQPLEGLCFPKNELQYLDDIGFDKMMEMAGIDVFYGDPADVGDDNYSLPMAKIINGKVYVHDVIFTKDNISQVEPRIIVKVGEHEPVSVFIEANNAGALHIRDMRKNIPLYMRELLKSAKKENRKMVYTKVRGVKNTSNKMIRIISQEGFIKDKFVFRAENNPDSEYGKFMKETWRYLKNGKEKRDDAPDSLAGLAAMIRTYYAILLD